MVACGIEVLFEEAMTEAAILGQAVHAAGAQNVYLPVRCGIYMEVKFLFNFLRTVAEFYLGKFWPFEWCHEVEVGKFNDHKMCIQCGIDTVEEYFDDKEHRRVGAHVVGVVVEVATHGCTGVVGFSFLCADGTDKFYVGDTSLI